MWNEFLEIFSDKELSRNLFSTGALLVVIILLRMLSLKGMNQSKSLPAEDRRAWIVKIKSAFGLILILGLTVIWATKLQAFAVSLVAVAAAVVIALKEVIMNVSGYFSRASGQPFSMGDRIEVSGVRGDVIDQNLFFTKIVEIGPENHTNLYTGRLICIPNSTFLGINTTFIINESFNKDYTLHVFQVPVRISKNLMQLKASLLDIANQKCKSHLEQARKSFEKFSQSESIEAPSVEPKVHLRFIDKDTASFIVRIPTQTRYKGRIEQEILHSFSKMLVENYNEIDDAKL